LSVSPDAAAVTGLEAETVRFENHERLSHFLLLQHDGVSWAPCAQVLPNNTALVMATPTWTCCEEAAIMTLWQIALAAVAALLLILGISVGAVTLRRQLHKQKMSKGPYRVILTPADFVFPQIGDNRRVSVEKMLIISYFIFLRSPPIFVSLLLHSWATFDIYTDLET